MWDANPRSSIETAYEGNSKRLTKISVIKVMWDSNPRSSIEAAFEGSSKRLTKISVSKSCGMRIQS